MRDFAKSFHGFYRDCRVIGDDPALTQARLVARRSVPSRSGERARDPRRPRARRDDRADGRRADDTDASDAWGAFRGDAPIDLRLLPRTAAIDGDGRLSIGGCDVAGLAQTFGTPLYVYDEDELRARCREYLDAFGDGAVAYAAKAFLCVAMARLVADEGLHLDVATGGEAHVAHRAGFPAERMVFHGNNKSELELRFALELGVGRLVVDGVRRARPHRDARRRRPSGPRVLVRVTPGVEAHTHEYIATGADDSKFGFTVSSGAARDAAVRVAKSDAMDLVGFHCHIGSQILVARVVRARGVGRRRAGGRSRRRHRRADRRDQPRRGPGRAVHAPTTSTRRPIAGYASFVRDSYADACAAVGLDPAPRLGVEAGRSIAGPAGLTLYSVGSVKEIVGVRTYVAVDGGMSDNPRPVTYGARYEAFVPARAAAPRPFVVSVAGKHCEQGDILVKDAHLPADLARRGRARDAGHGGVRLLHGVELQPRCRARRSSSSGTATRGSSCAGRRSRISSPATTWETDPSCRNVFGLGSSVAGTSGSALVRLIHDHADVIEARSGVPLEVARVAVRDLTKDRGLPLPTSCFTDDAESVVGDPDVDIVVEVIGGIEPARSLIVDALMAGKPVVTANKELLGTHGRVLVRDGGRRRASTSSSRRPSRVASR